MSTITSYQTLVLLWSLSTVLFLTLGKIYFVKRVLSFNLRLNNYPVKPLVKLGVPSLNHVAQNSEQRGVMELEESELGSGITIATSSKMTLT